MKAAVTLWCLLAVLTAAGQDTAKKVSGPYPGKKVQLVETSCGTCSFGMEGDGCRLAVRIKGKAYFVDGFDIDSFGDAHAADGFCNAVRKARVQGSVVNNRFRADYFRLLPAAKGRKKQAAKG